MTLGRPPGAMFIPFIASCVAGQCFGFSTTLPEELSEEGEEDRVSDRS